jgi:hypothetical protein
MSITINSVNYSGEVANILFKPVNVNTVINLGNQVLPYVFDPSLLTPPRTVYGVYTILIDGADCPIILNVPVPTPTPTPTPTVTPTMTVTPTVTPTITPTYNPCLVTPTPTVTNTPTVTRTPTSTPTNTPTVTRTPTVTPTVTRTPPIPCDFDGELLKGCDFNYEFLSFPPSELFFENLISGDYIDGTLETDIGVSSIQMSYVGGGLVFDCTTSGLTFAGLGTEVPQFQNYIDCDFNLPLSSFAYKVISPIEMTFTFTPAVTNPLLFFWSLGTSGNCQTFSANTAFQNFNYCYNTSGQSLSLNLINKTITGCEGYGVIEFPGTFNQIKISVLSTECRSNFLWSNIIYGGLG